MTVATSHTLFKNAVWLFENNNTLTRHNVMQYFETSPFYDNTCNNSVLKMQNTDLSELVKLVGVEYGLYHAREPFVFIIRKYYRRARDQLEHLATYNVIAGEISQAPTLGAVLESRLVKISFRFVLYLFLFLFFENHSLIKLTIQFLKTILYCFFEDEIALFDAASVS